MQMIRTGFLLAVMTSFVVGAGTLVAGPQGFGIALALAAVMNVGMWFFSGPMVLRMYKAQVVTAEEAPELYALTADLAARANLPMPTLAIVPEAQPNAFATGRSPSHAVVAVTEGLLRQMPRPALDAVIAHELAHIKNRDMLISTIAAAMAGALSQLPNLFLFSSLGSDHEDRPHPVVAIALMIFAPIAALLMQMAISRQREFAADATAAAIMGTAQPMQQALQRLGALSDRIPMDVPAAVAPLAQVSPFGSHASGIARLFATHPPLDERIAALNSVRV